MLSPTHPKFHLNMKLPVWNLARSFLSLTYRLMSRRNTKNTRKTQHVQSSSKTDWLPDPVEAAGDMKIG